MSHGTALCFSTGLLEKSWNFAFLEALVTGLQGKAKRSYKPDRLVGLPCPGYKSMDTLTFQELWDYIQSTVQCKARQHGHSQVPEMTTIPRSEYAVDFTVAWQPQNLQVDMDTGISFVHAPV